MRKVRTATAMAAVAATLGGGSLLVATGSVSAHHAEISTRCDQETGETIVSLNIVYPTGSATFGGESIPLNTPIERRITQPTQLVLDGPGTAYDDVQTVVPVEGCEEPPAAPPNCDTSVIPGSVAGFLAEHGYDGGSCFDYTVNVECGVATGSVTNQPTPQYPVGPFRLVWNEGDGIADPYGPSSFPATFPEDYNGGSVTISYYIVGPESDWFSTNSGEVPNYWNGIYETLVVDTDCESPVTDPPVLVFDCFEVQNLGDPGFVRFWEDGDLFPIDTGQIIPLHPAAEFVQAVSSDGFGQDPVWLTPEACEPPVTEPPVTDPPVTEPPVTEPPVTEPPATEPPATTQPPVVTLPPPDLGYDCEDLWAWITEADVYQWAAEEGFGPGDEFEVSFESWPGDPLDEDGDGVACERSFTVPYPPAPQPEWIAEDAELPATK